MIADRHITINRTRHVPFDAPAIAPAVQPQPTAPQPVTPVSPSTRYRHATIAALFFGAAWLLVVPWLVGLGVAGTGVSLILAALLLVAARHHAKGV